MGREDTISTLVFAAILLLVLGLYGTIRGRILLRGRIRSRLGAARPDRITSEAELSTILQSRSLAASGHYAVSWTSLNKLIVQSGLSWGVSGVVLFALACAGAPLVLGYVLGAGLYISALLAVLCGTGIPAVVLRMARDARQRKFEEQLPEAIDTVVRSLKAGHSVSVAIASVAQNLSDPIGAEFRLAAAEMTYGLDLETAMSNLYVRVGQPDIGLVALAVSIQSKTGGNLAEVLSNLSRVIRERFKLRRKAYALSAEGRFSALILSSLPVGLFCAIWLLTPTYYSDVWDEPLTKTVLAVAVLWMLLGNYIMSRMVRIRV